MTATTFNDLLRDAGIDPGSVAILRHHTPSPGAHYPTIAALRAADPAGFTLYQDTQKENRPIFRKRKIWAAFVNPTPSRTLFAGLFDATLADTKVADWTCPYRGDAPGKGKSVDLFDTQLRGELSNLVDRLEVSWPPSNVRSWKRKADRLELPLVPGTFGAEPEPILAGDALVDALAGLGFAVRHRTQRLVQLRRGNLIVYAKRMTSTRPLVVHPHYLDIADALLAIGGVDIALPPRSYIDSNLREFPSYRADHRASVGRHGFAMGTSSPALPAVIAMLERFSVIETPDGPVRVVAPVDTPLTQTERLQAARRGQGGFRDALMIQWNRRCPIAGVDHPALLRASHIKPWRGANDVEKLDPYNGLLLCAHIDALFDKGLVSFDSDGQILLSSGVSDDNLNRLGLSRDTRLIGLDPKHEPYLQLHRSQILLP
ncbi:hypothetical protein BH10PSE12_BH10PSE12_07840 [soil metagenome]